MLNVLRKRAQSTVIQVLVLVIAIVFIFWGVGTNINNNRNSAATVNGEEISFQQYQRAYDQTVENFRQQFGGQIPPGFLEGLGIRQQVIAQLIQTELLRQGGDEVGIMVSDLAAQREIEKISAFHRDGHFDLEQYKAVLSQNRMSTASFEGGLKSDLQTRRVTDDIGSFAVIPESAIEDWLAYNREEVKLAYVAFDSSDFEDKVEVQDAELSAWFEQHKEQYRSEPRIRLKYLLYTYDEDSKLAEVPEEEVKARYESEKASFLKPEERHARQILFKVGEDDTEEVRAAKKQKAEEVLALAKNGGDFVELVKEYSEGPLKEMGGDLGLITKGRLVPSFEAEVFSLNEGEIGGVVETPYGYHIVKLEEIRPESGQTFDQVKDSLEENIRMEKAMGLTFERATKGFEEIMRAGSLDKYGQQSDEQVLTTDYFSRSEPPEEIANDRKLLDAAFSLNKGELSSLVQLSNGYAIVFVDDIQEPDLPELADVREPAVADYKKEKAVDLAAQAADDFLVASREKGSLRDAASDSEQVVEADYTRRTPTTAVETLPSQLLQDSFQLPWKEKFAKQAVHVGKTSYVYEVVDRRLAEEELDDAKREQVREQLLLSSRNEMIGAWLDRVKEQAEIWTNPVLFQ